MAILADTAEPPRAPAAGYASAARPTVRREQPNLRFTAASIAFHIVLEDAPTLESGQTIARLRSDARPYVESGDEDEFTYHEREFLSYARRDDPPFVVRRLDVGECSTAECRIAAETAYYAAGAPWISRADRERSFHFDVRAYAMYFVRSTLSVLHLILLWRPGAGAKPLRRASCLNEFDVIKIAKLWEAGELVPTPAVAKDEHAVRIHSPWLSFSAENPDVHDLPGLLEAIRAHSLPGSRVPSQPTTARPYMTGTVQLQTERPCVDRLGDGLLLLRDPAPGSRALRKASGQRPQLMSLSGVLRALLSFDDTEEHELPSIFKETVVAPGLITAVHKGTFLRVADHSRMPSPYFLLPHGMALHNEYLLRHAEATGKQAVESLRRAPHKRTLRSAEPLLETRRQVIEALEERVSSAAIHYPNLRALYEHAAESRGLPRLRELAEHYADELRQEAEALSARQRTVAQTVVATIALVFAGGQLLVIVSHWVAIPVLVLTVVGAFFALDGYERIARALGRRGSLRPPQRPPD